MDPGFKQFPMKPCSISLPDSLPVMVLSDCYLFPGCILPLFIFEERYRQMLDHALSTTRMFCIGNRETTACGSEDDILDVSTAGLIRASVKKEDGTSHLVLCGLQRIKLTGWVQKKPFRIATIEPIPSQCCCRQTLASLCDRALSLLPAIFSESCNEMEEIRQTLRDLTEPEIACDLLSYHFIRRGSLLRSLLAEVSIERRFELLIAELQNAAEQAKE